MPFPGPRSMSVKYTRTFFPRRGYNLVTRLIQYYRYVTYLGLGGNTGAESLPCSVSLNILDCDGPILVSSWDASNEAISFIFGGIGGGNSVSGSVVCGTQSISTSTGSLPAAYNITIVIVRVLDSCTCIDQKIFIS